jgi:hypothetical protein
MIKHYLLLASLVVAASAAASSDYDYAKGVFFVNEDWYGHNNSTVNQLDVNATDGEYWHYRVFQSENPGLELGCTACYGSIFNDRMYIVSKQSKDPGADLQGARLTVCDPHTMTSLYQITDFDEGGAADGRAFVGVTAEKGYISTSAGIYVLDLVNGVVTSKIDDTDFPSVNSGQTGMMILVNGSVFVAHQTLGVVVIDAATDRVTNVLSFDGISSGASVGSLTLTPDNMIWASVTADTMGSGSMSPTLAKIDPETLAVTAVSVPTGIYPPMSTWGSWRPDTFCASAKTNTLYWTGAASAWALPDHVYKYDIDSNEFSTAIDFSADGEGWKVYGACLRVEPTSDELYVSLFKGYQSTVYTTRRYTSAGAQIVDYPMIANYWFPTMPVFPEAEPSSGVAAVQASADLVGSLYNLTGTCVARNVSVDSLPAVPAGVYILVTPSRTIKLKL